MRSKADVRHVRHQGRGLKCLQTPRRGCYRALAVIGKAAPLPPRSTPAGPRGTSAAVRASPFRRWAGVAVFGSLALTVLSKPVPSSGTDFSSPFSARLGPAGPFLGKGCRKWYVYCL